LFSTLPADVRVCIRQAFTDVLDRTLTYKEQTERGANGQPGNVEHFASRCRTILYRAAMNDFFSPYAYAREKLKGDKYYRN